MVARFLPRRGWRTVGQLPARLNVETVAVSKSGLGLMGAYLDAADPDASLGETLGARVAQVWRHLDGELEQVYTGPGWIVALAEGPDGWFAIAATLKEGGTGSDYRLIRSRHRAIGWREVARVPARSLVQLAVASPATLYGFGAKTMVTSTDGGRTWREIAFPHESVKSTADGIAVTAEGNLLAFGRNVYAHEPETDEWLLPFRGLDGVPHKIEALTPPFAVASHEGTSIVLRMEANRVEELGAVPYNHFPIRIAAAGDVLRILARERDPSARGSLLGGFGRVVLRSANGGRTWKTTRLRSLQRADIAGARAGLGVTWRRSVRAVR